MRMTISNKLYIGIGVLAIALIGLAVFVQMKISATKAAIAMSDAEHELKGNLSARVVDHFKWVEALGVGTLLFGKEFTGQIDPTQCNLGKWYYGFKPPKELEEEYKKIEEPHKKLHTTAPKIIAAIRDGKTDLAKKVYQEETGPMLTATQDTLGEMQDKLSKLIEIEKEHILAAQNKMATTSMLVYAGLFLLLVSSAVIFLARPIKKNLTSITGWVNTLSTGDLTKSANVRTNDEIGDIASGLNEMVGKVKNVITQTIEASNQVSVAADQIAEANQNFSQRMTEQAASVEETSSTMEEMSASIRQTADNAREANKLSKAAKTSAESGIKVMSDTIDAMGEINKSSGKIGSISNVIEEIAFQTNLLALNAAVEAARAGEHGKGFAVVASEIRSLAQRASQSAKEITALIEDSSEKTGRGVQLAQELNKKLEEIGLGIKKAADLMDEVAASAQEQASGTNQVNAAVNQIDQMTQQNAALVEETSASAEELAAQAKDLMNLVSFFKVDEAGEQVFAKRAVRYAEKKKTERMPQISSAPAAAPPRKVTAFSRTEGKSHGGFEEF